MKLFNSTEFLPLPQAEKDQVTGDRGQNQSTDQQIRVCFSHLLAPYVEKISGDGDDTANQHGKKISVSGIPFDHDCAPLTNDKEIVKNTPAMNSARIEFIRKSKTLWWRRISGEIIPIENQATETLPNTVAALLSCPTENLIKTRLSWRVRICQCL